MTKADDSQDNKQLIQVKSALRMRKTTFNENKVHMTKSDH